ncbi:hypothetical protein B879_04138 [Cecembia lonarensis LW9]|uniref:Uncharacterized protein n=1 Tax=Cecembia lonarensis (strain CCUG 58316 / KCTC 22772 / LW9) TaxID=1225176 RepID=K1L5H9_CECL9|nr:hypothetical protein B879_04138 [Cecembia lonarensis LW9]
MDIRNSTVETALFIDKPERKVMEKKSIRMDFHPEGNHGAVPGEGTTKKLDFQPSILVGLSQLRY